MQSPPSAVHSRTLRALLLALLPLLTGCYVLRQAAGQFEIVIGQEPIDPLIESDRLGATEARKLLVVQEARRFAFDTLGLTPTDNYTTYYDTSGKPVSYVISACRKDRFESYVWTFPIAGSFAYKGFFRRQDALDEAAALDEMGYDVSLSQVSAYSTLGWFRDPVYSWMLQRSSEAEIVSVIIHELAHGTVHAPGATDFNEEMATFVGTEGALQFLAERYGADSERVSKARHEFRDDELFDGFTRSLYDRLDRLYRSDLGAEDKLSRRQEIFDEARAEFLRLRTMMQPESYQGFENVRLNNAVIVAQRRYGGYALYRRVFDRARGSWTLFLQWMREAAASPDPSAAVEALAPTPS